MSRENNTPENYPGITLGYAISTAIVLLIAMMMVATAGVWIHEHMLSGAGFLVIIAIPLWPLIVGGFKSFDACLEQAFLEKPGKELMETHFPFMILLIFMEAGMETFTRSGSLPWPYWAPSMLLTALTLTCFWLYYKKA